jgi:hypothetical protein
VEVVGFWRLAAVCRLSLLVGSRSLARASSHHRALRRAREPHVVTRKWWFMSSGFWRWNGAAWIEHTLSPDQSTGQPMPPIVTGFRRIAIQFNSKSREDWQAII